MRVLNLIGIVCLVIGVVTSNPVPNTTTVFEEDGGFEQEYADLKYDLVHNLGFSKEFSELVEINLKRAVREEKQRQRDGAVLLSTTISPDIDDTTNKQQQRQQGVSEEDYEDESTMAPGPTTPGASPGDVVRGVAGILTSLGTFNLGSFWNSFVNFFPPGEREGAQALVDASLGRRPGRWPTLPSTTTRLTTSTRDEDLVDNSEEVSSTVRVSSGGSSTPVPGLPGSSVVSSTVRYSGNVTTVKVSVGLRNGFEGINSTVGLV